MKSLFSNLPRSRMVRNTMGFDEILCFYSIKDSQTWRALFQNLSDFPCIYARCLAKTTGKIMSLHTVLGNICSLMTRFCYMEIVSRKSWDAQLHLKYSRNTLNELNFGLKNLRTYSVRFHTDVHQESILIYSDASNVHVPAGAYTVGLNQELFHKM